MKLPRTSFALSGSSSTGPSSIGSLPKSPRLAAGQIGLFLFLILCLSSLVSAPVYGQVDRPEDTFYIRAGGGLSDYTGDATGTSGFGDLFETDKFDDGPFPYAVVGELGYQTSPSFGIGLGYQLGQYPLADNRQSEFGGSIGTVRHTLQILGRYTVKADDWAVAPYVDGGANASFGGRSAGIGYTAGIGLDAAVSSRTSLFLETRFNFTFGDEAVDGIDGSASGDALNALPVAGLKVSFQSATTPPQVLSVDGPTTVQAGESATYTASINEEEATRPLSYEWQFGDGSEGTGPMASNTYGEPGTYTVTANVSNRAGSASGSVTVEVTAPPEPARIASISADPNPADEGESVQFSSSAEGDTPLSREWSFGDGSTATGENPTHTYEEPGQYTARLRVSNEAGEDSRTVTVRVNRTLPEICTTVSELNSSFFERNSSTLTEEAESSLQENADILSQCTNLTARVEGFAAPGERNPEALSEDRAESVAGFYEANGVPAERIQTSGEGQVEGVTSKKGGARQYRRVDSLPERENGDM